MINLTSKCLSKRRSSQVFCILTFTVLSLTIASFLGCGSGGGAADNSTSASASNETPSGPELGVVITSIETDECPNIKVKASITDENNQLIENDPALVIKLYVDGVEQTDNFSTEWMGGDRLPMTVVFAMDYSGSMSDSREELENGVKSFIDAMGPSDRAAVIKFYYKPELKCGLTSDKADLYNAVDEPTTGWDSTNIWDAVFDSVGILTSVEGPSAVILFTDGGHYPGEYPVYHTLEQVIDSANQHNVAVFSIAYDLLNDEEIRYLSEETGGIYYDVMNPSAIEGVYMSLFDLLEKQYFIVFTNSANDGQQHSIQILAEYNGITGMSTIQAFTSCVIP